MTSADTVAKTTDLAMRTVARHLLDHDLPVREISAPRTCLGESSVLVNVWAEDVEAWLPTIHVDDHTTEPTRHPDVEPGTFERAVWHGRLPDTGVRVSVWTVRHIGASGRTPLVSVPGGAA